MPFNRDNAATFGSKGGLNRWKDKDPETKRDKKLLVTLTQTEYNMVAEKAEELNLSKANLVIRAVMEYKED